MYQKLRRLNYLCLLTRQQNARWERWNRKDPQNRVIRQWIRNSQGQKVGSVVSGPQPEPKRYRVLESHLESIEFAYRLAKYPMPQATLAMEAARLISVEDSNRDFDRLLETAEQEIIS